LLRPRHAPEPQRPREKRRQHPASPVFHAALSAAHHAGGSILQDTRPGPSPVATPLLVPATNSPLALPAPTRHTAPINTLAPPASPPPPSKPQSLPHSSPHRHPPPSHSPPAHAILPP